MFRSFIRCASTFVAKPSEPGYYTGNANFFSLLHATNSLMKHHGLSFVEPPPAARCVSQAEMATLHDMTLTRDDYALLAHNLRHLSTVEDVSTLRTIAKFMRQHSSSASASNILEKQVIDGKCVAIASRKTARANVVVSRGTGTKKIIFFSL